MGNRASRGWPALPDPGTAGLAALAAGLAVSPLGPPASLALSLAVPAGAGGLVAAVATDPGARRAARLLAVLLGAVSLGLVLGEARVGAIDAGALRGPTGGVVSVTGHVLAPARRSRGAVRVRVQTPSGRLEVQAPEPVGPLRIGHEVTARGTLAVPQPWLRANLRRHGVHRTLKARRIAITGRRRGGPQGAIDGFRDRAEAALGRGVPGPIAELVRGMVLGQDAGIDARTQREWKRTGLAHLLAVSGQNVVLLCLLAGAVLAVLGVPLRPRLLVLLALVALYVPLTGAGPSIQRAGVMGAAGLLATLASRPRDRRHAVVLAAAGTLLADPRSAGDVGWQLSFAAVIGILLWSRGLADWLRSLLGGGPVASALADGAAVTVAATAATAPLMSHHFGAVSLASLPANLIVLPAVAPVMWLGMLACVVGQVPSLPVELLTVPAGALAAFCRSVGSWLARPEWAQADVRLSLAGSLAAGGALLAAGRLAAVLGARGRLRSRAAVVAIASLPVLALSAGLLPGGGEPPVDGALSVEVLDVGQGDAILLRQPDLPAVLVDGGDPGAGLLDHLRARGVDRLAAAIVTHPDRDHAGGIVEALSEVRVDRLLVSTSGPEVDAAAAAAGVRPEPVAQGDVLTLGCLRLEIVWPRRGPPVPGAAPNDHGVVARAECAGFSALLTGDAESESAAFDLAGVDVLKVAHHGSDDQGLPALLAAARPRLAVISVGEDNRFGHPTPATIGALAAAGVPVRRTDRDGTVRIDVEAGGGWSVR